MRAPLIAAVLLALPALAEEKGRLTFQIDSTPGPVKAKKGEKGEVRFAIKPEGDAHVDPRAPMEIEVKAGGALELVKQKLGYADGKENAAKALEFQLPFTAKAAGLDAIKVHADFFLCNPKLCERQKADVTVAVVVE